MNLIGVAAEVRRLALSIGPLGRSIILRIVVVIKPEFFYTK
jgi:hypothetical protein